MFKVFSGNLDNTDAERYDQAITELKMNQTDIVKNIFQLSCHLIASESCRKMVPSIAI